MGEAKLRAREIAEIKRWGGRLIETPKKTKPVMFRAGDDMWMISDAEFGTELAQAHALEHPIEVQAAMARLALIAERSGLNERECQQWFMLQLKVYADAKLAKPMPKPIVFATSNK